MVVGQAVTPRDKYTVKKEPTKEAREKFSLEHVLNCEKKFIREYASLVGQKKT